MHPGQKLVVHVHQLINRVAIALPQKAHQGGVPPRPRKLAQTVYGRFTHVVEEGALIVVVEPQQINCEDAAGRDRGELVSQRQHRLSRRLALIGLDLLKSRNRLTLRNHEHLVKGISKLHRNTGGNLLEDVFAGQLALLPNDPGDRGIGRLQDLLLFKELLDT